MRDPQRIYGLLFRLGKAWEQEPDLRLGQLIVGALPGGEVDPHRFEDEELIRRIEQMVDMTQRDD